MSNENNNSVCNTANSCIFDATAWKNVYRQSGVALIGVALILALIIILINALHTASTWNNIIMFITIVYAILSAVCWFGAMFIMITLTTYYLTKYIILKDYSVVYMTFILSVEYLIMLIISHLHMNYFYYCCCLKSYL
ncbi:unnamed protein product, partial [Schistosoma turkestanicum]